MQRLLLLWVSVISSAIIIFFETQLDCLSFRSGYLQRRMISVDSENDDALLLSNPNDPNSFLPSGVYFDHNYQLGDIFNMPSFRISDWNKTSPFTERYAFEQFVGSAKTFTLFDAYFHKYSDFDYSWPLSQEHRFPNVTHLRRSLQFYGESVKLSHRRDLRNTQRYLDKNLQSVTNNDTLLIHFRGGDKGLDDLWWFQKSIRVVLTENKFTKVIVMSGVHNETGWLSIGESLVNTQHGVDWIVGNITALGVNCTIHYGKNPDADLYLISQAHHFLAHRGGFSALGALVCSGIVYFSTTFAVEYGQSPEFIQWIRHPKYLVVP